MPDRPRPPSVERLLVAARPLLPAGGDPDALTAIAREVVAGERARLAAGEPPTDVAALAAAVAERLDGFGGPDDAGAGPVTVINATGVILHTNLGRAPWPAAAIAAASRAAGCLFAPRVRPRRRPARAALPGGGRASDRADRRRGCAGHDQQRGRAGPRGRARGTSRRRGLARRARGDRRRGPDPGDRPPRRREAGRGRHDEPDPRRRLRGAPGRRPRDRRAPRPSLELRPDRVRGGAGRRVRSRRSPTRTTRSSSTTWAAARCSRRPPSGWPTSRRRPNGWPRARISSRSAATSWSVDRRPGWSSAGPTSSPGSARTRWRAPSGPTR